MTGNDAKSHGSLSDPRVYLAVERTYLAWIRTGLALMGFGFVVARVIPTAIANARFMSRHLLPESEKELKESA